MSLVVNNLTKLYGNQRAVDKISFSIGPGEIVGFLGPNGAGKSTTMKIATGYLPPTEGEVRVGGFDVVDDPISVKKIIGYLPEHNPLYLEMYVHEYLQFVGRLSGLKGETLNSRVEQMVALCGLTTEQNKKIESLSKGYRQRVGLAQALLHDPQILILDEPTSGLDPNQILEIRKVIKDISRNKTVLFSSHIMQEVQALCDRVIIINKGKIVADDLLTNLLKGKNTSVLIIEFKEDIDPAQLARLQGVTEVIEMGSRKYKVISDDGADVRNAIFRFATEQNKSLMEMKVEEGSMESIFRELTEKGQ